MSRYLKVALFFILLGGAGGTYIILSSDGLNAFNTKLYSATLQDATGLSTRSKVYLAGVAVGKIEEILLEGAEARLKIAFLKHIEIRENARLARKSSSILGTSILALDPGTELSPLIPEGGRINTERNSQDINAVMGTVQDVGGQFSQLLEELQANQLQALTAALENFNALTAKLNERSDVELERVSRILEAAALIAEQTRRILEDRETDIEGAAVDIRAALENLRMITEDIRQGQGNLGQVLYDEKLYHNLLSITGKTGTAIDTVQTTLDTVNSVAVNVNGVVDSAAEIVDRALGLGIQVDALSQYDIRAGTMRAGASLRLEPASNDRWYRIGVSSLPEGIVSRTVKETTTSGGLVPGTIREDTIETKYTVAFNVELARRFGPITLRGGLLYNTAGLGIDIQPIRWVSLSGEVFDFKAGEVPNLRSVVTIFPFFDPNGDNPWNWLYFQGGVNDILRDKRDFFLGGGVRFADREVRGLVGLVPFGGRS
ncbi:MAG: MlaD family protein [Treponema sp.]|jgi:phospholipid/cholesterol/gamma-HCH transport system substrate-binding protein|nr:MlaD family protein [Treponema sp.]